MSEAPFVFRIDITADRPTSGQWHCGPNPCWVTVTHLPTMTEARAYHRSQHKAREAAMVCVQLMLSDTLTEGDTCSYPEALSAAREAAARREGWNAAMEAAATMIEGTAYTSNGDGRSLEPVSAGLVGMDMHHATIAAAIRAMKETEHE